MEMENDYKEILDLVATEKKKIKQIYLDTNILN